MKDDLTTAIGEYRAGKGIKEITEAHNLDAYIFTEMLTHEDIDEHLKNVRKEKQKAKAKGEFDAARFATEWEKVTKDIKEKCGINNAAQ